MPTAVREFRAAGQQPFSRTSTFVLRRLSVGGSIVYQGHEGRIEANVVPEHGPDGRARLSCVDVDGEPLFSLETYDAAERSSRTFSGLEVRETCWYSVRQKVRQPSTRGAASPEAAR